MPVSVTPDESLAIAAAPTATVATLTGAVEDADLLDGAWIWVQSRKRYFALDKASAAALVDGEVVATKSGAGRWVSMDATTSFTWSQIATWNLNGATGNDDNDGTILPLKTGEELARRIGIGLGRSVATTINVLDGTGVNLSFVGVRGSATVVGTRTGLFSGTLTAQTPISRSPGPGNPQIVQASGLPNTWTALGGVGQRIRLTSGATLGTAWIAVDDGTVNNQAETTPFVDATGTNFTPAGTENFSVETLTAVPSITIDFVDSFSSFFLTLKDVKPTTVNAFGGFLLSFGCDFSGGSVLPKGNVFFEAIGSKTAFVGMNSEAASAFLLACLHTGPIVGGQGMIKVTNDGVSLDSTIFTNADPNVQIGPVFAKNTTANKVIIDTSANTSTQSQGGGFVSIGVIYGSTVGAATVGVILGKGARVDLGGFTHTFTSTGSNWAFGSTGKSHAQLPFVDQFNIGIGPVVNANMAQAL